jgi:CheY-like chemotaxis protein
MDMPVLSGPAAAAAFRAWEAGARPPGEERLPIMALTANVATEHAAVCAAAGMNLFLAKPLRAADMPLLRAHAVAHAESRAMAAAAAAALPVSDKAAEAAAAAAESANALLGARTLSGAVTRATAPPAPL